MEKAECTHHQASTIPAHTNTNDKLRTARTLMLAEQQLQKNIIAIGILHDTNKNVYNSARNGDKCHETDRKRQMKWNEVVPIFVLQPIRFDVRWK